ncbi:2'-5' RNA ligase family protein [Salininema proteolyticum]|uniref:2'-5' RNA ligase family protein n=1 Tax=Salininema proteolyticum TaxID=1607685 RepID=A0ABV8TW64_9ACTN
MGDERRSQEGAEALSVGVAIPLPEPWLSDLDKARIDSGDPLGGIVPAHLTLLAPTEITAETLPVFERHLAETARASEPFLLHLRGTGTFRPVTDVVFVTVARGIASCERLAASIGSGPVAKTSRYPYHPHVTVAQNVSQDDLDTAFDKLAGFEAQWTVDHFILYTHSRDVGDLTIPTPWTPRRKYDLGRASHANA